MPVLAGISALEHVDELDGGDVDHGGEEAPAALSVRRLHDRLVEADHGHGADPGVVIDALSGDALDRRPHRGP